MNKGNWVESLLPEDILMTLRGRNLDELSENEFMKVYPSIFETVIKISKIDISEMKGYGEFTNHSTTQHNNLTGFINKIFDNEQEGYWYHWREIFDTTMVNKEFFEQYYRKLRDLVPYSEDQRYFVYNNAFFENLILGEDNQIGFIDWRRVGIFDWFIDIAILDLNKPYLHIPELFYEYCVEKQVPIPHFKERFLCMGYLKGLDTLRWHASIDDEESCETIMISMSELEGRLDRLISGDRNEV